MPHPTETTGIKLKGTLPPVNSILACHDCDLLQKIPNLSELASATAGAQRDHTTRWTTAVVVECPRCGAILRRSQRNSLDRTIAWISAGLILYFAVVTFPFLAIQSHGISNETALMSGIIVLYQQGMGLMSLVVLLTCLILPLFSMLTLLYVLVPLRVNRQMPGAAPLFSWSQRLRPWGMMEVYLLAILVSMVKLSELARIIPGPALYSFIALIFVLAASSGSLDSHLVWNSFPSLHNKDTGSKRP